MLFSIWNTFHSDVLYLPSYQHKFDFLLPLLQKGIYRVPGGERMVKALRERYINGKRPLMLSRVDEIHVVCGLLKDFLRKLKEPLITFRLHRTFMETCGM